MLRIKIFSVVLFLSLPCFFSAFAEGDEDTEQLDNIFKKYLSPNIPVKVNGATQVVTGDFNGDGLSDFAVVFLPVTEITETDNIQLFRPWRLADSDASDATDASEGFHRSLAIFHGGKQGVLLDVAQVFVLLDDSGALETPSFELLITRTGDKDYNHHASALPAASGNDLIIIPTEAGIDTYIYWHKSRYRLFEPEDSP